MIHQLCHGVSILFIFGVLSVQSSFDKLEGDACESDGVAGKCVHIYRCLSAFLDLKKRIHPTICSFQGREPIICCTDCKLVDDARKAIIGKDGTVFFKSGQIAKDKCIDLLALLPDTCETGGMTLTTTWLGDGTQSCKRFLRKGYMGKKRKGFSTVVVGGTDAERYNFTHMALLNCQGRSDQKKHEAICTFQSVDLYGEERARNSTDKLLKAMLGYGQDRESAQWHCGGSLISERFILTAGHCLSDPLLGPVRFVVLGILKRSDPAELWQVYNVQRIIPHPEYRPPSKYHDIALLETDKRVTYNKAVFPACLDVQGKFLKDPDEAEEEQTDEQLMIEFQKQLTMLEEPVEDQTRAVATGWGTLGKDRPLADTLQKVYLNRFSKKRCLKHFSPYRNLRQGYNETTQMCYGDDKEAKDTCEGDSGGPIQVMSQIARSLHTVIGVTSFGRACGYAGDAGMYTRVFHYVSWIESVVWPEYK